MGSKQVLSGVTVRWNDAKHPKLNVKAGARYKNYIKGDLHSDYGVLHSDYDDFTPSRIAVDLKLDLGNTTVSEVVLDDVHVQIAYSGAAPTIGWWNGAKWVKFEHVAYANHVADVTLPSPWPTDPPIGTAP
jgi:hypothetical protein